MRASSSDRTVNCPASLVLPRERRADLKRDDAAAFGTLVHHWMETGYPAPSWGNPKHVDLLLRKLRESGTTREQWWEGGEFESTWALNLRTLDLRKYEGDPGARDAWKESFVGNDWLTGTIDCAWPQRPALDDLKTGYPPVAAYNKQLLSYGLFLWLHSDRQWDAIDLSITHWPKYPINGVPTRRTWRASGINLQGHLDDLRWAIDNTELEWYDGSGNGHCRFCESKHVCKEWR